MKALIPRIDIPDPSDGSAAPAYAISQTLTSQGTEYLFANLGCGVIGVYSVATGQLVREIATGIHCPKGYFGCLGLLKVTDKHGSFGNVGRTLLATAAAGGHQVYVLELDLEAAAQQLMRQKKLQQQQQQQAVVLQQQRRRHQSMQPHKQQQQHVQLQQERQQQGKQQQAMQTQHQQQQAMHLRQQQQQPLMQQQQHQQAAQQHQRQQQAAQQQPQRQQGTDG
eukprot:GHRR01015651.1.p1 GENE.GHRR01015651.1~~GHRR01015651.1.p1  ORF type:complete len:223 (+),score=162.75 GHRR01015651.1:116-784(+)